MFTKKNLEENILAKMVITKREKKNMQYWIWYND